MKRIIASTETYKPGDVIEWDSNYIGATPRLCKGVIQHVGRGIATHGYTNPDPVYKVVMFGTGKTVSVDHAAVIRVVDASTSIKADSAISSVKASVDWSYFNKFDLANGEYLPSTGEGNTMATQVCTAVTKLVYKWYNDGDVFDNSYGLDGWGNDLSSYANWLYKYVPQTRSILSSIVDIFSESEYENLLKDLADTTMDLEDLERLSSQPKQGSIYNCDGPFKFEEYSEEDDYDDYEDDYEEDDY